MPESHIHIALIHRCFVALILAGEKTAEARLSVNRIVPFERIAEGDRIYFKQTGGPFVAAALAGRVETHQGLNPCSLRILRDQHEPRVLGGRAFWRSKARARYATIVELLEPEPIAFGPDLSGFVTPGSRSAWHVLPGGSCVYPHCVEPGHFTLRATG